MRACVSRCGWGYARRVTECRHLNTVGQEPIESVTTQRTRNLQAPLLNGALIVFFLRRMVSDVWLVKTHGTSGHIFHAFRVDEVRVLGGTLPPPIPCHSTPIGSIKSVNVSAHRRQLIVLLSPCNSPTILAQSVPESHIVVVVSIFLFLPASPTKLSHRVFFFTRRASN